MENEKATADMSPDEGTTIFEDIPIGTWFYLERDDPDSTALFKRDDDTATDEQHQPRQVPQFEAALVIRFPAKF